VAFSPYQAPEFETLWQLFSYFDPEGAGYLDQARFSEALRACLKAPDGGLIEGAWCDTGGEAQGVANFCRFAAWAESYPLALPLGLSAGGGALPIRCHGQVRTTAGELLPCGCECYSPSWPSAPSVYAHPPACHCGHRRGRHWCDADARLLGKAMRPASWTEAEGLVPVHDVGLLRQLQELLTRSHKETDNWTRDRGCSIHGVGGCSLACANQNRLPVPSGYSLRQAWRNQQPDVWRRYCVAKCAVSALCSASPPGLEVPVMGHHLSGDPLDESCNEWRLFHGTSWQRGSEICGLNFRSYLAGTGATWKKSGEDRGEPLYGRGVYLTDRITKSDEYSKSVFSPDSGAELHTMLVVRCVGGRCNVQTGSEIDTEGLRNGVFFGPFDSVCGDRVTVLNKPYREFVFYDRDQCYPEFLLRYERQY